MNQLDELPVEVILAILQHLPLKDVLNCKQVNKKLNAVINSYLRLKQLVVIRKAIVPSFRKWFGTSDSVDCRHVLTATNIHLMESSIFSGLKQLFVYKTTVPIKLVNSLVRLERLELEYSFLETSKTENSLKLPELRIAQLYESCGGLVVCAPKLLRFQNRASNLSFAHPESLETYDCLFYNKFVDSFVNLVYLLCAGLEGSAQQGTDDLLRKLPKLREVHTWSTVGLENLKKQKAALHRHDLSICFHGIRDEVNIDRLISTMNACRDLNQSIDAFSTYRSNLASIVPRIEVATYERLNSYQLPVNFIRKFVNLSKLIVSQPVQDLNRLSEFLRECNRFTSLRSINFRSALLSQEFVDQLPELVPNLTCLSLDLNVNSLNCWFLLRFSGNFETVHTDQELDARLVCELVAKNRGLAGMKFMLKKKQFWLVPSLGYKLKNKSNFIRSDSLDELFDQLISIREPKSKCR